MRKQHSKATRTRSCYRLYTGSAALTTDASTAEEIVAHPNPDILGEDLKGDLFVGADGYRFGEAILEVTDRGNWVDYLIENPATGNQEYKHSWVVKRDGLIFGSGWYQVLPKFE